MRRWKSIFLCVICVCNILASSILAAIAWKGVKSAFGCFIRGCPLNLKCQRFEEGYECACLDGEWLDPSGHCVGFPCDVPNSDRMPGPQCACKDGFAGVISWKQNDSTPQGICNPAPCDIYNSNKQPGAQCACSDGYSGTITWNRSSPQGNCNGVACAIPNSNNEAGSDCACKEGFLGSIVWTKDVPSGNCTLAECNISHSNGLPGHLCKCSDGYTGSIVWSEWSLTPDGMCTAAPCNLPNTNGLPGPDCACAAGYLGWVSWKGVTPNQFCTKRSKLINGIACVSMFCVVCCWGDLICRGCRRLCRRFKTWLRAAGELDADQYQPLEENATFCQWFCQLLSGICRLLTCCCRVYVSFEDRLHRLGRQLSDLRRNHSAARREAEGWQRELRAAEENQRRAEEAQLQLQGQLLAVQQNLEATQNAREVQEAAEEARMLADAASLHAEVATQHAEEKRLTLKEETRRLAEERQSLTEQRFQLALMSEEHDTTCQCCIMASDMCGFGASPCRLSQGIECAGESRHFVCNGCLDMYVLKFADGASSVGQHLERHGRIFCPMYPAECDCEEGPYTDVDLARRISEVSFQRYLAVRQELVEVTLAAKFENDLQIELNRLAALEEEERAVVLARNRIHDVLTWKCPACAQAYTDFTGCCALKCSRCPCNFCAWCGKDCGNDAHPHVRTCPEKPEGTDALFPRPWASFEKHQKARRRAAVEKILDNLKGGASKRVRETMHAQLRELMLTPSSRNLK